MEEEEKISKLIDLTKEVYSEIERELKLTGFWDSTPARNKLTADLQKVILQHEYRFLPDLRKNWKVIITRLMEIAKKNHDTILFAP